MYNMDKNAESEPIIDDILRLEEKLDVLIKNSKKRNLNIFSGVKFLELCFY